jgi:hypothetical protein
VNGAPPRDYSVPVRVSSQELVSQFSADAPIERTSPYVQHRYNLERIHTRTGLPSEPNAPGVTRSTHWIYIHHSLRTADAINLLQRMGRGLVRANAMASLRCDPTNPSG